MKLLKTLFAFLTPKAKPKSPQNAAMRRLMAEMLSPSQPIKIRNDDSPKTIIFRCPKPYYGHPPAADSVTVDGVTIPGGQRIILGAAVGKMNLKRPLTGSLKMSVNA